MKQSMPLMNSRRATIAAVVITKNEEANIDACLNSLAWVDHIIVVDAESTDRTVEIAKQHTDAVYIRPWAGYGPQKNFGIDQTQEEWILIVDADERVTRALQMEIVETVQRGAEYTGYEIPRKNYFYGQWMRHGGMYPDWQLRLFRKSAGRYDETLIHERLVLHGERGRLVEHLEHHSIPTIVSHVKKLMSYTTLAARQKRREVLRVSAFKLAGNHLVTLFKTYIARGGWQDGVPGLIAAGFAGLYTFLKYAKLYEMSVRPLSRTCRSDANRH